LRALQRSHPVFTGLEVRVRIAADLYRIPDISMREGVAPDRLPAPPPLLVEVSSPDDRLDAMLQKLDEYRAWGVLHISLVEPERKRIHVHDNGSLTQVSRLELPQFGFAVTDAELFGGTSPRCAAIQPIINFTPALRDARLSPPSSVAKGSPFRIASDR
jgi:Uma2 family endonuclease